MSVFIGGERGGRTAAKRGVERERGRRAARATEARPDTIRREGRQRGGDWECETMLRRKRSVSFGGFGW